MSVNAGSVFVRLGGIFDRKGFDEFEANTVKAQKVKDIKARLGGEFDSHDFDLYQKRLDETRERTKLRGAIKATLGADYDSRAFNAYYRDLTKAKAASLAAADGPGRLSIAFDKLAKSAGGAGGALGGGGGRGLGGLLPGVSGGFLALVGVVSTLLPVLLGVAGAATAVAGSLAAAAAGAAAVGVGIGAALGPLAAIAGAVAVRVAAMTDAFKALGTEQTKGGDQAKASGEAQYQAAQRVAQAQENLTKARFTARREVEDLTNAVIRSTLAEQDAALALRSAQESAAGTIADPRSTQLQRDQAEQDVKDARQRSKDAVTDRQRAITDERRGTDTLRQAEHQLADARHAATIAAQKEGAAATDAQQKLGQLSATERRLVIDFKAFVDQLTKIFKPATDAIFGAVDRALRLITPMIGEFKQRFEDLGIDIAGVVDRAAKAFTGPGWTQAMDTFITTAQKVVKPIGDSVGSVLLILRNIAVATQPYVIELANNIRDALGGLADKTKDPTKVRDVIKGLVDQTKSWLGFMGAVAKLIFTIFSGGAKQGQGLLDQMTAIVRKWTAFLGTEEGQRKMREFFRDSIELTKKVAAFLGDVVDAFYKIGHFLLEHTNLIKLAAGAWVTYKLAAIAAGTAAKGAALASFIRGPGAAGAGAAAAGTGASTAASTAAGAGAAAAGRGAFVGGLARGGLYGAAAIGGLTAITQAIKGPSGTDVGLVNKYADALDRVVKSGDKQGMRDLAKQFRETAHANQDLTKGENLKRFAYALDATADRGGKDVSAIADAFSKLPPSVGGNIEKVRRELGKLAIDRSLGSVDKVLQKSADNFADWRKTGSNNMAGLHTATAENMVAIKKSLGEDSAAGKDALVGNFKLAEDAVRDAMTDGKVSTRDGLREIRRLMKEELAVYGIKGQQATDYLRVSGHGSGNETIGGGHQRGGRVRRAVGGWLGARGMVSDDIVPIGNNAIAALGEYVATDSSGRSAVINRHQAPVADLALGMAGYGSLDTIPGHNSLGVIERALEPLGGLDSLFASITRPHNHARGGRFAGGGRVQLPASFTPTHQTAGLDGYPAIDVFGQPGSAVLAPADGTIARFSGKSPSLGAYMGPGGPFGWSMYLNSIADRSYFLTHFGSRSVRVGQKVSRGQVIGTVGDYPGSVPDHIHEGLHNGTTAISKASASSAAALPAPKKIKAPRIIGGGVLGQIVQGAMGRAAGAATDRVASIVGGGALPGAAGGTASGNGADLIRRIAKERGWNFADWWALDGSETSHGQNLSNPTSSARLRGQFLDSNYGKYGPGSDPSKNPSMSQQILSMARYIAERYGNPTKAWAWHKAHNWYAKGGRIVQRFASGGRAGQGAILKKDLPKGTAVSDLMRHGWSAMRALLPGAAPNTAPQFVVSDLTPGTYAHAAYALHGGRRRIALTQAMVDDLRAGSGTGYGRALHALTHEWAHTQQKPSMARQPPWIVEGGAEAFARDNDTKIWGGKARPYGAYSDFVNKVRKTAYLGKNFINSGQFIGGKVLNFATGGWAGGRTSLAHNLPSPSASTLPSGRVSINQLRGAQRIRVKSYDDLTTSIADEERRYGQAERRYNQSDEVLIDPVTGAVNQDAIEKRAGELASLMKIRQRILDYLERQLVIARRVVKTYTTIIGRLSRSLKHAKGKDRSGIRADIAAYGTERDTWQTNAKNVGFDIGDAKLDIGDLQKEGAELRGTTADTSIASSSAGDLGASGDTGTGAAGDTSTTTSPDIDAIIAQIQARADAASANLVSANQVIAAFSSSGDIGTGGSTAFNATANEAQPVGAQFAPAGSLQQRSATVNPAPAINIYTLHPGDPATLRAVGDAATAGQSLQPSVSASKTTLGI